ncbi:MAG: polymerase, sigma-24 subunit, subfamily [Bryobacterales bacterium]|jgi:RNA polymerase sigma-70 factor (ECF subfamily)|nr:polymerase, sigma-24 subunit, subfamily [Bryobacterales bacterium]
MNTKMQPTDEALYRRMKQGDRDALAVLYDRREPSLYRYALHMTGSVHAAEEIAQEVFVQLMSAGDRYDETRGPVEAWLYGVARNLVRVFRRRGSVEEAVDQAVEDDIVGGMIADESLIALREAVRELPGNYREVVVLCDIEERNYDEAARLIGCPVGTIRSRLHRARALLATKLKRYRPVTAGGGF